jgi:hypothetical protein
MQYESWTWLLAATALSVACSSNGDHSQSNENGQGGALNSGGGASGSTFGGSGNGFGGASGSNGGASGAVSMGGLGSGSGGTISGGGVNSSSGGAGASSGGASAGGAATGTCAGSCAAAPVGSCSAPQVRVTQVDLGAALSFGTDETSVTPLAIAAVPGGGSRIAWMTGYSRYGSSTTSQAHIAQLDCDDKVVGTPFTLEAHDFQDLAADGDGGVIMLTRDAQGSGDQHCGDVNNLCILPSDRPGCYGTYMVRYGCGGDEKWATLLTSADAATPPYTSGGRQNTFVWWYQHQGRIAYDGTNYAGYFCDAITVTNDQCVNGAGKVDIHEGDRMQVLDPSGNVLQGHDSFGLGCSHSGFTRVVWDAAAGHFVMVCKTDNNNRIAQPSPYRTIYPVTLDGSFVGDVIVAKGGGYWLAVSNAGSVHLLHFASGQPSDQDVTLATANYPHLVDYGPDRMIAFWASTQTGSMTAQVLDRATGATIGSSFAVDVPGHPYQSWKSFPDGSVAYAAVGSSSSTVQIARILPCQ